MTYRRKKKTLDLTTKPKQPVRKPRAGSFSKAPRTRNDGKWTETQFITFVKAALRGARWEPKYRCINAAFVGPGINPATGHKCKLHRCPECLELFPQNGMAADHVTPVVGMEGFQDWNTFIERLFVDSKGFRAVCKACHKQISNDERSARANFKSKQLPLL